MSHWWPSLPIKNELQASGWNIREVELEIFLSFERTFSFWKDVSMGIDGKLVNGKESLCVCKQFAKKFYICAAIMIALLVFTIYRIIVCFRIVYKLLNFFEKLVFKKVKVRDSVQDSVFASRSAISYIFALASLGCGISFLDELPWHAAWRITSGILKSFARDWKFIDRKWQIRIKQKCLSHYDGALINNILTITFELKNTKRKILLKWFTRV